MNKFGSIAEFEVKVDVDFVSEEKTDLDFFILRAWLQVEPQKSTASILLKLMVLQNRKMFRRIIIILQKKKEKKIISERNDRVHFRYLYSYRK